VSRNTRHRNRSTTPPEKTNNKTEINSGGGEWWGEWACGGGASISGGAITRIQSHHRKKKKRTGGGGWIFNKELDREKSTTHEPETHLPQPYTQCKQRKHNATPNHHPTFRGFWPQHTQKETMNTPTNPAEQKQKKARMKAKNNQKPYWVFGFAGEG